MLSVDIPTVAQAVCPPVVKDPIAFLEGLLKELCVPHTRSMACQKLHALAADLEKSGEAADGLSLKKVQTPGGGTLKLLLHPAVFPPEEWSRTFAEGLLKDTAVYAGKSIVEIGVGCGWISLLMLEATAAHEVVGLDINPVAVLVSKINAWLNGTNPDGTYRLSGAGRPLPESFSASVSDLLAEPLARNQRFDHVIGCIPQVLHPDPEALVRLEEKPSEKDLYDLSNYCFEQGIVEDRYGLPLVARALAQSHLCLKPGGTVTFMMGGRPGQEPIEDMFKRRGFVPQLVWSRRVHQAGDTDIASLAALEKHQGITFRFYVSQVSTQSIPASTVVQLLANGKPVYHDVFVYKAAPKLEPASVVLQNLNRLGIAGAWPDLDLSRIEERQARFLEYLTNSLLRQRLLPPQGTRTSHTRLLRLAQLATRFLRTYCQYGIEANELVIGLHSKLVPSLLKSVSATNTSAIVSDTLYPLYKDLLSQADVKPTIGNSDLSDLLELDEALCPQVCIISAAQLKDSSAPLVVRLLAQHADRHRDRLYIVDDSQHFEASCDQTGNRMLKLLGHRALAPNIILLYRHSNPPFEVTGLLNVPAHLREVLDCPPPDAASQVFYEWLFSDLLRFTVEQDYADTGVVEASGVPEELAWNILRSLLLHTR